MTPTLISVINQSTRVTDDDCAKMVHSIGLQLARDVAPVWGRVPALEFVPNGVKPGGIPCTISDTPDVPGAAGYHDEGADGIPYIKVFTFDGGSALTGNQAVSVTLSHEIIELTVDAPANKWADTQDGSDRAYEACDAPEAQTYDIDGVTVSNFVYQAFFDPKAQPGEKVDHLGLITAPFMTPPDGYQIARTEPGNVSQVFAAHGMCHCHDAGGGIVVIFGSEYPEHKKARKIAKASRRRG